MQTLAVVDLLKEVAEMACRVRSIAVVIQVDFLTFESAHKSFRERIVVRISRATHADFYAVAVQDFDVFPRAVLHASVRVMHQRESANYRSARARCSALMASLASSVSSRAQPITRRE